MKNRLIGSRIPFTTCTPTSREITGTPGMIATNRAEHDHRGDDVHEHRRLLVAAPDPLFVAERLGDHVGGGDRQDRRGEQARPEQADRRTAPRRSCPRTGVSARAASAAEEMLWIPCVNSVAPVAMMMKAATMFANTAPETASRSSLAQLVLAHAALDHRRLQVELHVGGDRRADGGDQQQQEGRVGVQVGTTSGLARRRPNAGARGSRRSGRRRRGS